jgi:hypothetical protein
MVTEKFPDDPLDPIPLHRLPYSMDTYSQSVTDEAVRHMDQTEVLTPHPFPLVIDHLVLPGLDQQHGLGKSPGFHAARTVLFCRAGINRLNGQPLAALGPTTIDNRPPVFGLHSGPKAMGAVSFEIAGLKSSLAHDRLPCLSSVTASRWPSFNFCCLAAAGALPHTPLRKQSRKRKKSAQQ